MERVLVSASMRASYSSILLSLTWSTVTWFCKSKSLSHPIQQHQSHPPK